MCYNMGKNDMGNNSMGNSDMWKDGTWKDDMWANTCSNSHHVDQLVDGHPEPLTMTLRRGWLRRQ